MKRFTRIPFLFFVGGVLALYARCIFFSFIGLDDAAYTFRNPFVAGGLSVPNIVEAFTNLRHGGIWMPVTYVSYMLDSSICRWTGLPLMGEMHFVNVLLHVANFLLLVKLIRLLLGNGERGMGNGESGTGNGEWGSVNLQSETRNSELETRNQLSTINYQLLTIIAAVAAMIWAVHPLRVEPVAWIAARKELLWTLFTLVGLISWIKGWKEGRGKREEGRGKTPNSKLPTINYQLSTIICCALACLSKPTAMCFPFLLLLVTWWMRKEGRRTFGVRDQKAEVTHNPLPSSLFPFPSSLFPLPSFLVPLLSFLIAAATAAIAAYSQTHVAGQNSAALYAAPFAHRLVNALSAIGYYLRATFWPFGLHVDCRAVPGLWPLEAGWNFTALGVALLAVGLWKYLTRNSKLETQNSTRFTRSTRLNSPPSPLNSTRLIIFAALWFLISLLPTLGLFGSFGMEAHADRFAYLPSMAFAFLLAGFFARKAIAKTLNSKLETQNSTRSTCSTRLNSKLVTLIVIVLFSFVTFQQLSYWRDDWSAHQRALDCDPAHPRAMVHVADARCSRQRDFNGGIALYRKALSLSGTVPKDGLNVGDVKARLAYALASRGGYDDFAEVKKLGSEVLRDFRLDRRGMMLDALGTAFMAEGDAKRAALLFKASIEAPDRFWPKASTRRKLESCK